MTVIKIEWDYDESNCDTCGWNYSEGAIVTFDGEVVLELEANAGCTSMVSYTVAETYKQILEKLGHTIEEVDKDTEE